MLDALAKELDAAHGVSGSSLVTVMARNGVDFGIRVSEFAVRYQLRYLYDLKRGSGLLSSHGAYANGSITAASLALTTALPVSSGGTGVGTFTSSQLLYGNATNALSSVGTTTLTVADFSKIEG